MRRKTMKRVLVTVLCLVMTVSFLTPTALAEQHEKLEEVKNTPDFSRIISFVADLSISSRGLANCYSRVRLANSTDTVTLTMELQRQNGSSWTRVNSWSTDGSGTVTIERDWFVASGHSYRIQTTARVFNSNGALVETSSATSGTVRY